MIVVIGDLNAKVGNNNANREEVIGNHGERQQRREILRILHIANGLAVAGTLFPRKEMHKLMWRSPDGKTVNQIDHVTVNGRMRTSTLDTRVMRGADVYSDHYLVRSRIRLKLARVERKEKGRQRFDVRKLQSEEIRRSYNIEVKNRFEAIGDIVHPEE